MAEGTIILMNEQYEVQYKDSYIYLSGKWGWSLLHRDTRKLISLTGNGNREEIFGFLLRLAN